MPDSVILHPLKMVAIDRGSGVFTVPLVTRPRGAESFLSGITTFEPCVELPLHTHNCLESVVILQGDAVVEIAGVETALTACDTTIVDADVPHRFRNASDSALMHILWVYGSADATRTVVSTAVTVRIDAEQTSVGS